MEDFKMEDFKMEYTNSSIINGDASEDYRPENQMRLYSPRNDVKIKSGQGVMEKTKFGAKRESNEGRGRFDLLPYEAIEALAKWYEAGASKYSERNWENGISVKDCINRMVRHALKAGNGWTDEDHLAAVMWNAAAAITMMQRRPDCNDHKWIKQETAVGPSDFDGNASESVPDLTLWQNDIDFLITALQTGGINDIETLAEWVHRRR